MRRNFQPFTAIRVVERTNARKSDTLPYALSNPSQGFAWSERTNAR